MKNRDGTSGLDPWGGSGIIDPRDGATDLWKSKEAKAAYDAWEETEPPVGDGWQLWETVSEGSPISPVIDRNRTIRWQLRPP